jgi:hypothetical protein
MADPLATIQATTETLDALSLLLNAINGFVPKLIAVCCFIAAAFPHPDPSSKFYPVLSVVRKIIDSIAINIGHAKNKGGE